MNRPSILLMGQTPPPWHGQAVATKILFDHDWPGYEVHRLRMEYSTEMLEVGRFQLRKIWHLFELIIKARSILRKHPGCLLFYPPSSAKWVPFVRDAIFLTLVRPAAGGTIFIFHASGLPVFVTRGFLRNLMGKWAYRNADVSLEVAQEELTPHAVFGAGKWEWCPCGIEVPDLIRPALVSGSALKVLFVASLQEGKGVLEILKTARVLKSNGREGDFHFKIVGRWFSEEFEREARNLHAEWQLETMVDFAGQLTGDSKWQAYAEADVFFFPSHYSSEATPIVLMEALGSGLPIVSTRWAGIPAMLNGCETAWLLPVRSPDAFAAALEEIDSKRHERDSIEQKSRAFYEKNFKPERFIERVERAFHDAGEQRKDNSPTLAGRSSKTLNDTTEHQAIQISAYLADQNPGYDRSFGISRMSQMVLGMLQKRKDVELKTIVSQTSQQSPQGVDHVKILPWGTRCKTVRLLTDHFHPIVTRQRRGTIYYYPKGYLPLCYWLSRPSVVTIHDTIIQFDSDHYPTWRKRIEYGYWSWMLKHTLRHADRIMTVSESAKQQILAFMKRHGLAAKEIAVTYEPCMYENEPQPENPEKGDYVIHLASTEPHKRTAHLMRWWCEAERMGMPLPTLHLIGHLPAEVKPLLASARSMVKRPFLDEGALQSAYRGAKALIFPSEIEGFGLPALEAYYLGTPVCFVKGTSVEEVLGIATPKGGFDLNAPESLHRALEEVLAMTPEEVRNCGLTLRKQYASENVVERMMQVFRA